MATSRRRAAANVKSCHGTIKPHTMAENEEFGRGELLGVSRVTGRLFCGRFKFQVLGVSFRRIADLRKHTRLTAAFLG